MTDRETLRRLIVGTGEHRIDSFEAADRVLAAGTGASHSTGGPPMTTPNLAPCPFCTGPMTIEPIEAIYGRPKFCPYCAECDHCGEHYPTPAAASAAWNARFTLPSRAWEMGRDAALDQLLPMIPVAAEADARRFVRALTPPATLARTEISEAMVNPVYEAMLAIARPDVFGADLWDLSRAALTAALTDGESNG